jgi:hypothetical protein
MKKCSVVRIIMLAGLLTLMFATGATAGQGKRRTRITFSGPVRVPGAVLQAGTYYFSAPNSDNRALVLIQDENNQFITQFLGIYDFTQKPDHEFIVFGDHECGPKAIKSWFYPGASPGVRFVYPAQEAALIAAACNEPVPDTRESTANVSQVQNSNISVMTAQKQEEPYKAEAFATSDQKDQRGFDSGAR